MCPSDKNSYDLAVTGRLDGPLPSKGSNERGVDHDRLELILELAIGANAYKPELAVEYIAAVPPGGQPIVNEKLREDLLRHAEAVLDAGRQPAVPLTMPFDSFLDGDARGLEVGFLLGQFVGHQMELRRPLDFGQRVLQVRELLYQLVDQRRPLFRLDEQVLAQLERTRVSESVDALPQHRNEAARVGAGPVMQLEQLLHQLRQLELLHIESNSVLLFIGI